MDQPGLSCYIMTKNKLGGYMAFIVLEGVDGSGKSTLIKKLSEELSKLNIPVVTTREPGSTPLGEEVRHLLLKKDSTTQPSALTELFLYQACRRQNVDMVIKPALEKGSMVISDRFWASTYAFQFGGRSLSEEIVLQTSLWASEGAQPDLWILLDLKIEDACQRWEDRTLYQPLDRFETENLEFHQRVYDSYQKISKTDKYGPWLILDATLSSRELLDKVLEEFSKRKWI